MKSLRFFSAAAAIGAASAAFPAQFPYEMESYRGTGDISVPPLHKATPSFTFEVETETGGFIYNFGYKLKRMPTPGTITDDDLPFNFFSSGQAMWGFSHFMNAPPVLPSYIWNCTRKEITFGEADFTGMIGDTKVCEVGECCSNQYGLTKYGDDQITWHNTITNKLALAGCDMDLLEENVYCMFVSGDWQVTCQENIITTDTRAVVPSCGDNWIYFYMNCKVYTTSFVPKGGVAEPPLYVDDCNNSEFMAFCTMLLTTDKVCHDYFYFHPDAFSDGDDDDDDDDDDSAAGFASIMGLAAIALL